MNFREENRTISRIQLILIEALYEKKILNEATYQNIKKNYKIV